MTRPDRGKSSSLPPDWLVAEMRRAADETKTWPKWKRDPRFWHPTLGRTR